MSDPIDIVINATDNASGKIKNISGVLGGLGSIVGGVLKVGLLGGTAALAGLTAGIGLSVKAAADAQKVDAQLDAVLKATGGSAGITKDAILKLADALSKVTPFEDEMIAATATVLLQFRSINKDVFPEATRLTLDLATRLGVDAPSAAKLLGKALETPGEGLMRLKAAGVAFDDEQTKMIKGMADSGDMAGAQAAILKELEKSIGGAAKAAGGTFAGQLTILQNSFQNVQEEVGVAFLPMLTDIVKGLNTDVIPVFKKWAEENMPKIQAALKELGDWIKINWPKIEKTITDAWEKEIKPALDAFKKWLDTDGKEALQVFYDKLVAMKPYVDDWVGIINDLKRALSELNTSADETGEHFNLLGSVIGGAMDNIKGIVEPAMNMIRDLQKASLLSSKGDWLGAMGALGDVVFDAFQLSIPGKIFTAMLEINTKVIELGRNMGAGLGQGIRDNAQQVADALRDIINDAINNIKNLLGIHSPSAAFAAMGEQMAQGLMGGFGQPQLNFAPVIANVGAMGAQSFAAGGGASTGGGSGGGTRIEGGITINFNGVNAPTTQAQANQSASLFVDALRAKGISV